MEKKNEILSLFHHIHHFNSKHEVHHCGGKHVVGDPKLNYKIKHCKCGKHSIDKKSVLGHSTDEKLQPVEAMVEFIEICPDGGWHIESGIKKI